MAFITKKNIIIYNKTLLNKVTFCNNSILDFIFEANDYNFYNGYSFIYISFC